MRLLFKQRLFSWFDSYDIFDEQGNTVFTVKGELSWGHKLKILSSAGVPLGMVKEVILAFLPKFELYIGDRYAGRLSKEFTFFRPKFHIDFNGWQISGNLWEWDYTILDAHGRTVAVISKNLLRWTDTYTLDICDPRDALGVLMVALAIDAEKCRRD